MGGASKKRKAKNKQKNLSRNASSTSNDVLKHQDSNVGGVSSIASQSRISTKGNEETGKIGANDGGVNIKDVYIEKDRKIEQDELSTSNSAGSSDDEPRGVTNNPSAEDCSAAANPVETIDLLSESPGVDEITLCAEKTEIQSSSEDKVGSSDPKECEVLEKDDRLIMPSDASNVHVNSGAEGGNDSVTQPLLERPSEKTSWKSCCGLFEFFTGSAS